MGSNKESIYGRICMPLKAALSCQGPQNTLSGVLNKAPRLWVASSYVRSTPQLLLLLQTHTRCMVTAT
jgi:hypothetical protein